MTRRQGRKRRSAGPPPTNTVASRRKMEEAPTSSEHVIRPSTQSVDVDVDVPEDDLGIQQGDSLEASSNPVDGPSTQKDDVEMGEYVPFIQPDDALAGEF
jgi:hypothetical protein